MMVRPPQAESELVLEPRRPPADDMPAVLIQYCGERRRELRVHPPDDHLTNHLTGVLRNRRFWRDVPDALKFMGAKCHLVLAHLGLDEDALEALAIAGIIQLVIDPSLPETCREFPWEFTIAEATRNYRRQSTLHNRAFSLVRHWPADDAPSRRTPEKLLVVESAPSKIADEYDFVSERQIVRASLGLDAGAPLVDPDLDELQSAIQKREPDIIHLAGVDGIQGAQILGTHTDPLTLPPKGMFLRSPRHAQLVSFPDLAKVLVSKKKAPCLVTFNFYNSWLGVASALEAGALAAIGFQDDVDDAIAEQFFGAFYTELRRSDWDLSEGFRRAWLRMGNYSAAIRGTGIILWSRLQMLPGDIEAPVRTVRKRLGQLPRAEENVIKPAEVANPKENIAVDFKNAKALNYSLLHNGGRLFRSFKISRLKPGIYNGVTVNVKLYAGPEVGEYQATFQLSDYLQSIDVADLVKVPLTSQLSRSLGESIYTTISYCVRWGENIIEQQTERIKLLPADQWRDDDLNRKWLPSFVLPRDVAVRRIVDSAQRYLVALADDSGAGFDGYQSYDPSGATLDEKCRYIDAQVRALWWALVYDYGLGYINPPPTFEDSEQRLRTPSEIIAGKRGTCIDLALLFASCLEYIDIYPVIFLLRDHAFPGYWRSEQGYAGLNEVSVTDTTASTASNPEQASWMFPSGYYASLMKLAQAGLIVPIETTQLTQRSSFANAVDEGLQNLRNKRHFHSLYDIQRARRNEPPVTPLPLCTYYLDSRGDQQ